MFSSSTIDKPSSVRHPEPKSVALIDYHAPLQPSSAEDRGSSGRRQTSSVLSIAIIALLLGSATAVFLGSTIEENASPEDELNA